ncbi:MAG: response regulator [Pseudomonadota bacterium]
MTGNQDPSNKFDRLRQQAEELIRQRTEFASKTPRDMLELIRELGTHQAELEIQNEELKRSQQELSELRHEYETLYEFAPFGYATLNPKGIITRINLTGSTLLGRLRERISRTGFSQYIAPGWKIVFHGARQKAGVTGEKQSIELPLKREKASPLWVRADIEADRDKTDAVIQWRVVLVDITSQRKAEEDRKRIEDQLRYAQKMDSAATLGGIAHEFNNVLSIIIGNNELVMDDIPEWSPLRNNLEEIRRATLRAKDVVRQFMAFSRKGVSDRKPVHLSSVVKEFLKLIRYSIPESIEIKQNIVDETTPIFGNTAEMNQIIMNICSNATDAMLNEGGILTIEMANETIDEKRSGEDGTLKPGPHVKLVIGDTGCGMDRETLERIYEPYFTTKKIRKGPGLGLSMVPGIVARHNGSISVESEPNKGTVFTLRFPACEGSIDPEIQESVNLPTGTERVLIVDDEPSILRLSKQRLERLGYRVKGVTSPVEALEIFRVKPNDFDLAITDMTMPQMAGDKLAVELMKVRKDIPVILCTGFSSKISDEKAAALGIKGFAMKPLSKEDLAKVVRKVLDAGK